VPGREGTGVADPYYGGDAHFDATWRDVTAGARGLAAALQKENAP
jgi:protein-tyrosine phosphatase